MLHNSSHAAEVAIPLHWEAGGFYLYYSLRGLLDAAPGDFIRFDTPTYLVGGFKYFLFSPLPGEIIPFD